MERKQKIFIIIFITAVLTFGISLFLGRYYIPVIPLVMRIMGNMGDKLTEGQWRVFYYIRFPRVIMVSGVGTVLALTGATYQSIFRNPLVSPDILGVSAGACFGVALGMTVFSGESVFFVYILAFVFGIIAVLLSYGISIFGKGRNIMMMVLAGIVVGSLFNALISLLKYIADPFEKLPGLIFWLMGGFSRAGWAEVKFTFPFFIVGSAVLLLMRWYLNVMSMGEEEAISLGLNVGLLRFLLVMFSTIMVAASVAVCGQVTWIGLVVPHIARYLVGSEHKIMLPVSALLGSTLLLVMDNLARTAFAAEIPISIITAFLGAPFFAYLLISKKESGWS